MKIKFYLTGSGRNPVEDFLGECSQSLRADFFDALSRRFNMAWKELSMEELAASLGVNVFEVREKQKLIQLIIKARKKNNWSQVQLAKKVGVTQGRIAQVESGLGTQQITFDVLFRILNVLGYGFKITSHKAA